MALAFEIILAFSLLDLNDIRPLFLPHLAQLIGGETWTGPWIASTCIYHKWQAGTARRTRVTVLAPLPHDFLADLSEASFGDGLRSAENANPPGTRLYYFLRAAVRFSLAVQVHARQDMACFT